MSDRLEPIVIVARPAQPRVPPVEISPDEIALLVDRFYADIRVHPRLGPLFEAKLAGIWDQHLERMNRFWRSVLMHTGEYSGQPVMKHNALHGLEENDFRLWIEQFESTAGSLFDLEKARLIAVIARRIARSLWLARFGSPFNKAPGWLD